MAVSVIIDTLLYNIGSQFIKINLENYNRQEFLAVWYIITFQFPYYMATLFNLIYSILYTLMIGLTLLPCRSELHRHIKMITQFGDIMAAVFSYR